MIVVKPQDLFSKSTRMLAGYIDTVLKCFCILSSDWFECVVWLYFLLCIFVQSDYLVVVYLHWTESALIIWNCYCYLSLFYFVFFSLSYTWLEGIVYASC